MKRRAFLSLFAVAPVATQAAPVVTTFGADVQASSVVMRARELVQYENAELHRKALEQMIANTCGAGLTPQQAREHFASVSYA